MARRRPYIVIERPAYFSRPLPDPDEPVTAGELAAMEALLDLIPNYPWRESADETGKPCVIVADDDADYFPSSIVEAFGTDNTALAPYIALAHNIMPRLISELRRRREQENVSHG